MEGIHRVLDDLQPVAGVGQRIGDRFHPGNVEGVEDGKGRPFGGRSEVREDDPGPFHYRVGPGAEAPANRRILGFGRGFQDGAVHVEEPAVVAAADTARLADAVLERCPAVRAVLLKESGTPAAVPEEDQLLVEHPNELRQLAELRRSRHRLPEAAHELPTRSAGSDVGELRVLCRQGRMAVAAIGCVGVDFAHGTPGSGAWQCASSSRRRGLR